MISQKNVIGASVLLLLLAAIFGALNVTKTRTLRNDVANTQSQRDAAERRRASQEKEIKERELKVVADTAKAAETENRAASAQVELAKVEAERAEAQAKAHANETEISNLQKRIDEMTAKTSSNPNPGAPSVAELQAQLEEARKELEAAEREKIVLSEKTRGTQDRTASATIDTTTTKRRDAPANRPGIRGTVLAVNLAYNFVVLNLGGRQGVEPNAEMLVLRGGSLIAKIRVSSVEPATAICDILTNSLARGVQVQPGDIVIYAGSNS